MTEDDALVRAIIESPDDDLLRLAYADRLEERGESERAEFIRLQCALAIMPEGDLRRQDLEARERGLLKANEDNWVRGLLAPLAGMVTNCGFRRGFMERLTIEARGLQQHAERLFDVSPLRELTVYLAAKRIKEIGALPQLARLKSLDFNGDSLSDWGIQVLAESPYLWRLESLRISWNQIGDKGAQALADCKGMPRLASLVAYGNEIGNQGGLHLALSDNLSGLKEVDLLHNPLGRDARRELRRRFGDRVAMSE